MTSALLIIDAQQGLCSGRYAVFDAKVLIERICGVAARVRAAGAAVVVIQHEADDGLMNHGSSGWQLVEGLVVTSTDIRMRKRGSDAFHQTGLDAELKKRDVTRLIICGMQSEFCVDSTTRGALAREVIR